TVSARPGRQPRALPRRSGLQRAAAAGGAGLLGGSGGLLSETLGTPRGTPTRPPLSAADRSGVGIRLPGGPGRSVLRRRANAGQPAGQLRWPLSVWVAAEGRVPAADQRGGFLPGQRLGVVRPARQPLGVVCRLVRG